MKFIKRLFIKMATFASFPLIVTLYSTTLKAQYVNLPAGDTMRENFDGMSKTYNATLPAGWRVSRNNEVRSTIGSFFSAGTATTQRGGASMSSSAISGMYNFAAGDPATATDRAIGGLLGSDGFNNVNLFVDLYNNGATAISQYIISYDVEKYRNGSNPEGFTIKMWYSTDNVFWYQPVFSTSFPADANNDGYTSVPITTVYVIEKKINIQGLGGVAPGKHFYLAWNYSVTSGSTTTNAQALGIDNINITAVEAPPPSLTAGALNGFGTICRGTTSDPDTLRLNGSNLYGSQIVVGPLTGYKFSTSSNGLFKDTIHLSYLGTVLNKIIYVQFTPTSVQSYNGNIPVSGGGAGPINIAATGAGINTAPAVATGNASTITTNSATVAGTITNSGCSSVSAYGIEYSTVNGFAYGAGTSVTSSNLASGIFSSNISGLAAKTQYYYRAYAANSGGTSYGAQRSFTTDTIPNTTPIDTIPTDTTIVDTTIIPQPLKVIALPATDITPTSFTANWNTVQGVTSYQLDVATTNDFSGAYVTGYENLLVNDTSLVVTGLSPNTTYYYRVRAANENTVSPNSNIITVTTAPSEPEPEPIPTTLQSFSGLWHNDKNIIRWTTATESNNEGFDLQRSSDSIHFQSINFTSSGAPEDGNSVIPVDYNFDDYTRPESDSQFYRLKVVNLDGTFYFSDVIAIRSEKKIDVINIDGLYPNPVWGSTINLRISTPVRTNITCSIIDSRGYIVKQIPLSLEAGSNIFPLNITGVLPGTYHLKCIFQGFADTRKFVVR